MKTEHNPQKTHKFFTVLANAFLEWILILLLLINSLFCYLIRTFAAYFKLNPPCPFCSKLDLYLLKPENRIHPYKDLICETHCKDISSLTFCSNHRKLTELSQGSCEECSVSEPNSPQDLSKCIMCTCCGKTLIKKESGGKNHQSVSENEHQIISDVRETPDEDSNEEDEINVRSEIRTRAFLDEKLPDVAAGAIVVSESKNYTADSKMTKMTETEHDDHDSFSTIQRLRSDLELDRKARNDLYAELEAERSAASIATNQTMAMITRLQQEKSTMQMEALQYQRVMEEQFEKELEVYRDRVSDYEAKDKVLTLARRHYSDSDSDVLSIDLSRGFEEDEDKGRMDISLMECSKEWGAIEDSLDELEGERTMIIQQLRELQEKLVFGHSDAGSTFENTNGEMLCSQEVILGQCRFVENQPKTMASVAKSLLERLPLSSEHEIDDNEKRVGIEKEMDHVYGRLQALEADAEFLRHCIGSLNKGNEGVCVLKEILQHLNQLKAAEIW